MSAITAAIDLPAKVTSSLRDADILAQLDHLGIDFKCLAREVRALEERQVKFDRRMAEVSSRLQILQEDHFAQAVTYERSQKSVTLGAQRALDAASAIQQQLEEEVAWKTCLENVGAGEVAQLEKRWESRWQEQQQWLASLANDVAAVRLEAGVFSRPLQPSSPTRVGAASTIGGRLAALEEAQKAVAVSARRALHTALAVHQRQRSQEQEGEWEKCLEGVNVSTAELEAQCMQRFAEQDERLDKILQIVDALVDKVQVTLPDGMADADATRKTRQQADSVSDLQEKIDWLEANIHGLACQIQQAGYGAADMLPNTCPKDKASHDPVLRTIAALESRMDKVLADFGKRVETLQDAKDEHRLTLRKIVCQLPEITNKLDHLWAQCQEYFPRIKEHEVHLGFFRKSFENQKQQLLELAEGLEQAPRQSSKTLQRSDRCAEEAGLLWPSVPGVAEPSGFASVPEPEGSHGPPAADREPRSQDIIHAGHSHLTEDSELKSRARTLAEVMARLSADFDSIGAGRVVE